jgi:LysM repeat protein
VTVPRAIGASLAVALLMAATHVARADEPDVLVYKAKAGDTLDLVAAEMYGDHAQVILLVAANKLVKPRPLKPGEKLRVPRNREYVTQPGDKLPALAKTLLGNENRAWLLARENHLDEAAPLAAGTLLEVPLQLEHVPAGPEPLTTIAQQYYGDAKNAELVKRYNALDHDTIDKGETIALPMPDVKLRKLPPLDAESQQRREKAQASERAVEIALPQASRAWRDGEFELVRGLLAPIDLDYVDSKSAIEAAVLLGKAELAFDDADSQKKAADAFKVAIEHGAPPLHAFDASPKVRAAWTAAGGTTEEK